MATMKDMEPATGPWWLGLETATPVSSTALFRGDKLMGLSEQYGGRDHARLITVHIAQLLENAEITAADLEAVCVTAGPGSYTGLRVGVSTAKGLCMSLGIPLISVSSLETLAWSVKEWALRLDALICPMIDARRMEVYCRLFDPEIEALDEARALVLEPGAFAGQLKDRKVLFIGSGAEKCRELFANEPNALVLGNVLSTAASMAHSGHTRLKAGQFEILDRFEPFYLKDFVATKPKKLI